MAKAASMKATLDSIEIWSAVNLLLEEKFFARAIYRFLFDLDLASGISRHMAAKKL